MACDEFDTEVLSVMKTGYAHGSELAKHAQALDEVADRARLDAIFSEAWRIFHDRIDGTAEDVMRRFVSAVDVSATAITPVNLNGTFKLLRELGFDSEVDGVIETYIKLNSGRSGLFRIDDSPWSKDIDDETLRKRFAEVVTGDEGPLDLSTAAMLLLEEQRWDDRAIGAPSRASPDDYVALFRERQGDTLHTLVDNLYRTAHRRGTETEPIAALITAALDKVSSESKLNEIRVRCLRK